MPDLEEDIAFAPVWRLVGWIARRAITSERLTGIYLDRIAPKLECVALATPELALPPRAAVRQVSMADITLSWSRLTWPAWAARQAAPCRRKMSAISNVGRVTGQAPASEPSISSLRRSSGLVTARIVFVATRAREAGRPVDIATGGMAADSLGCRRVGEIGFAITQRFVEHNFVVSEGAIRRAQRLLWDELRVISEPGGAVALAALVGGSYVPATGERVGVIVCGGSTDPAAALA